MKITDKNMVTDIKTKIFLFCLVLFSKELFANTRLSQLSTPGVQLHIEDCQAGVQRSSREKKLLKMQNEPNLRKSPMLLTTVIAATYNEKPLVNQKITNPIEPNTNPISKRPKTNANFCHDRHLQQKTPLVSQNQRTQSNPKPTQHEPNFKRIQV